MKKSGEGLTEGYSKITIGQRRTELKLPFVLLFLFEIKFLFSLNRIKQSKIKKNLDFFYF